MQNAPDGGLQETNTKKAAPMMGRLLKRSDLGLGTELVA